MEPGEIKRIVSQTATALVGFDWQPFDVRAVLRFRGHDGKTFAVRLEGLHLVITRQSLLGDSGHMPLDEDHWEDWPVRFFDVQSGGAFLEGFLNRNLGFRSHVFLYSGNGAGQETPEFVRPVHVTLATGGGHLDDVCESVQLDQARQEAEPGAAADGGA